MRILTASIGLAAIVLAGCGGFGTIITNVEGASNEEKTRYRHPDFTTSDLKEHGLANGGVVLCEGLVLDADSGVEYETHELTLDVQMELWAPVLDAVTWRMLSDIDVVRWYSLQSSIPDELSQRTHTIVSRRGTLMPALLAEWSSHIPHVTYLTFVRVDETWHENPGRMEWGSAGTINRDEDTWLDDTGRVGEASDDVIGRVVVLTMDIYDVTSGLSVWCHEVQKHVNPSIAEKTQYDEEGKAIRRITSFDEALDDALEDAVGELRHIGVTPSIMRPESEEF